MRKQKLEQSSSQISYWYSSTGSRIQRKVVKAGQPDSYTIYDGAMVYTFTGASPSLAGFGISEIQNGEGRYVNGKLEYGYTDHVGNLRLSYKDSLGVAFITQSQHYDPWSNVNAGSEYQLSGIQGDRYLVSGRENDNVTGNTLLDWRDYDSVTGRMNSYDPEDQSINMSGFAYCGNNPVMKIDPDGRFAFMPFLMMTLFSGHISGMISQGNGGSYGKGFLTGAVTSAIGGGVGAGMAGILGQAGTFGGAFLRGAVGGAVSGGISGGVGSMMNGGSFGDGFLGGAISGGITGGIMGSLTFKKPTLHMTPFNSDGATYSPMEATDQNLDTFCQEQFCGDYKNNNGIHSITTENIKVPKIYRNQIRYDANERLFFKPDGSPVGGITIDYNNRLSDILIPPKVFDYGKTFLFENVGHEIIHSYHHAFIGASGLSASLKTAATEYGANRWNAESYRALGMTKSSDAFYGYAQNYLKVLGKSFNKNPYNHVNIPNFPLIPR